MKKAIFLDRDGVINKEIGGWVFRSEDFEINKDVTEALEILKGKGFIFIVVTNQSGIAKGIYKTEDVEFLHQKMNRILLESGILIKEIFFCPHHDETGKCLCRKPDSLMLEKAIAKYEIDVSKSYLIGDKDRDIEAASRVGVKGLLIEPNSSVLGIAGMIS